MDPYFQKVSFFQSLGLKIFLILFFFSLIISMMVYNLEDTMVIIPTVTILSILMAFLISRYITQPITNAMKTLQDISKGNLNVTITTNRHDELGNLIFILNETLHTLREAQMHTNDVASLKSNFITVAAHQLRTPATGVKWALDSLAQTASMPPEAKTLIDQSRHAVDQIVTIVNDILNSAKVESTEDNTSENIDIVALVNSCIEQESLRAREKNIQVVLHNETYKDSLMIPANKARLTMAITNILDNAVRYNKADGFVEVTLAAYGTTLEISFKDTGIGIPSGEQSRVFSQFYRATNGISVEPNGSGVGLFITKKIIERHQGKIWFETEENKGTVFHVALPTSLPQPQ